MKIEHLAFNVEDPVAFAAWYVEHLGLKVISHNPKANQTHFLSDGAGGMVEIYCNPPDEVPDYKNQNPLLLHFAFESKDPTADSKKLIEAGAEFIEEIRPNETTHLIMLRDPWGLALQLCKREPTFH